MDPALLAGTVSTVIFAAANVPMLAKAVRTRDLGSYSLPSLVTVNVGNAVHTAYVVSLPPGPIWVLHGFYLAAMLTMLALYVRYVRRRDRAGLRARVGLPARGGLAARGGSPARGGSRARGGLPEGSALA